jgi:hypothetical protein
MAADINEVLNFLAQYAARELAALRRSHPKHTDTLLPNHFGVTDQALEIRAHASVAALLQVDRVIVHGLHKALDAIGTSDRIEDLSAAATALGALCSALAAMADAPGSLKIGAALFTLLASAATLVAKRKRRSVVDKDIREHVKALSEAQVSAPSLRQELEAYLSPATPKIYDDKVAATLTSVNALMRSINLSLLALGLESIHA